VILGLSLASILVTDIDILNFSRGGGGPFGLTLGLDLEGGSYLVFQTTDPDATEDDMKVAANTIERRVNAFGLTEPVVQIMGSDRIMVQLPGVEDIEEAKKIIGETALLEFKERTCLVDDIDNPCEDEGNHEDKELGLTGDDLTRAWPDQNQTTGAPIISIQFNSRGTSIFADFTKRIAGDDMKRIAIILDGEDLLAPVARSPILNGQGFIEGSTQDPFTFEEVQRISIQLNSGRLRVPLELIQETTVDAILGSESLEKSLQAGLVGLGLVLLFMVAYYRVAGLVAALALANYVIIALAVFKLLPVTLTLAGIAGFVLSIGMAVDANILIFERVKEELRTGRSLSSAIQTGFRRAWTSIRDGNISTLITCAILYWFGSRLGASLVQGFAVTLFLGVAISMFSAIVVSRNLLQLLGLTRMSRMTALFTPERLREIARTGRES
jgi:preprotein translocase subunit SecD